MQKSILISENERLKDKMFSKLEFESTSDCVKYLKNDAKQNTRVFGDKKASHTSGTDDGWLEFNSYKEALNGLEFGFDKYVTQTKLYIEKAKNFLYENLTKRNANYKTDVAGFVPVVPKCIMGLPENMLNQDIKDKKIPTIKIMIDKCACASVKRDDVLKYSAVIFVLIEALEMKNIRCQLSVYWGAREHRENVINIIKIKDFMQPLNIYKMQFPIVSSDMNRRIGFRLLETNPDITDEGFCWGYGMPLSKCGELNFRIDKNGVPTEELQEILNINENDVFIPSVDDLGCGGCEIEKILEKLVKKTNLNKYILEN